jgi:hypothetical protein
VNRAAGNSLKQVLLVALLLIRSHLYGNREGTFACWEKAPGNSLKQVLIVALLLIRSLMRTFAAEDTNL